MMQVKNGKGRMPRLLATGLAALLLEARPTATLGELQQAIYASCVLPPGVPRERANRGIPDGVEALAALTGTVIGRRKRTPARSHPPARKTQRTRRRTKRKTARPRPRTRAS